MQPQFDDFNTNPPTTPQPEHTTWHFGDILIISIGIVIIFVLGIAGLRLLAQFNLVSSTLTGQDAIVLSASLGALEAVGLIGSIYLFGLRRRHLPWSAVGIRPLSDRWRMIAIALGVVVIPASGLIAGLIQLALGQPLNNPQLPFLAPNGFSWFGAISMFLLGGIAAPIGEELFFRGIFYQWLRDRWGIWAGIIISGLIFGALHGEPSVAGAAAVLGMLLAWVYEHSQSLWAPVLIHVINNSAKIILLYAMLANGSLLTGG
jgi:membrane protease YdiL (CAAX protease family)